MQCAAESSESSGGSSSDSPESGQPSGSGSAHRDVQKSRVMFRLQHGVAFGEQVKVVGDGAELGNWDIDNAPSEPSILAHCHVLTGRLGIQRTADCL